MSSFDPKSPDRGDADAILRIEELLADRALGNLAPEGAATLRQAGISSAADDPTLLSDFDEMVAALTESTLAEDALPTGLAIRLEESARPFMQQSLRTSRYVETGRAMKLATWAGWAVAAAACVAMFLVLKTEPTPTNPVSPPVAQNTTPPVSIDPSPAEVMEDLLAKPDKVMRVAWKPLDNAPNASGEVVWSAAEQTGVMRFANLPVNDPTKEQYQLWIFDATRNEAHPVDGGVFDSKVATGEQLIRIDPRVPIRQAAVFAVTLEQPGGTVVSDRKRLVVITDPPAKG